MKTLSVRDIRQRWPEAERILGEEGEIIVTRDRRPVARLLAFRPAPGHRKRLDPARQMARLRKLWKGQPIPSSDALLRETRADRPLIRNRGRP